MGLVGLKMVLELLQQQKLLVFEPVLLLELALEQVLEPCWCR